MAQVKGAAGDVKATRRVHSEMSREEKIHLRTSVPLHGHHTDVIHLTLPRRTTVSVTKGNYSCHNAQQEVVQTSRTACSQIFSILYYDVLKNLLEVSTIRSTHTLLF